MTKARSLSDFIESDGSVTLVDNQKIKVGTGNDLEIYHDGSHSFIYDGGVGDLKLQATNLLLEATDGTNYIHCADDGAVRLYYNGSTKLTTTSNGVDVTGVMTASGGITSSAGTVQFSDGGASFDSSDSSGYPVFKQTNGSAQLGLERTGSSTGKAYIGADNASLFHVYNSSFAKKFDVSNDGNVSVIGTIDIGSGGTASAPSLTFEGDNDTGLFHGADTLGFSTAGSEAMRMTSDGRLQFSQRAFTDTNNSIGASTNNYLYVEGGSSGLVLADNADNSNRILIRDANNIEFQTSDIQRLVLADTYTAFNDTGADCDFLVESASNTHAIFVNAGTDSIHFGTTGNFGGSRINVEHPTDCFGLNLGPSASGERFFLYFNYNGSNTGSIKGDSTGVTYNTTSDIRLKTDIEPIKDSTEKLMSMNPVEHKWKADQDADSVHGFIAQEMQEIVPEAVSGDPEGEEMMSMDYGRITPIIVGALQDAHNKIIELENKLKELGDK